MIFHAADRDLDFELGGRRYVVPFGSEVELPDHLAYCVAMRGLSLKEGACGGERVRGQEVSRRKLQAVPTRVVEEELAEVIGLDPAESDDVDEILADESEESPVAKAAAQLERQGVTLPGRRPRKG